MSEPAHLQPDPEPTPTESDPLLDSGSYIDPGRNDSGAATESAPESPYYHHLPGSPEFAPGVVIAAEPISMYVPGEDSAEPTPRSAVRRRSPDEMLKRPTWLPEGWTIDLKVRASGASAGLIDRYYVEPTGQRRFRSKVEVLHFLETGSKPTKRKLSSETDAEPSGSPAPASQKQKKSNTKRKKSDTTQPRHVLNGVEANNL